MNSDAHNPKVIGSNPIPATKKLNGFGKLPSPFFVVSGAHVKIAA